MTRALGIGVLACALGAIPTHARGQASGTSVSVAYTHSFSSGMSARPTCQGICASDGDVLAPVSLSVVELEVALPLRRREAWELEYALRIVPLARLSDNPTAAAQLTPGGWTLSSATARSVTLGWGIKPLGVRVVVEPGPVSVHAEAAAGAIFFGTPALAANASRINFVLEFGVGVDLELFRGNELTVGIRRHHLSNAGIGEVNPGLNSYVLVLGLRFP